MSHAIAILSGRAGDKMSDVSPVNYALSEAVTAPALSGKHTGNNSEFFSCNDINFCCNDINNMTRERPCERSKNYFIFTISLDNNNNDGS
jgi:hypothetical protein